MLRLSVDAAKVILVVIGGYIFLNDKKYGVQEVRCCECSV